MPLSWIAQANLTLGVNYRNIGASRTSRPGEAQDSLDMQPREDGAIQQHYGWERVNPTALAGEPQALKGFTYRGKNIPGGTTARTGNLGIANDGADFTRRVAEYPGFVLLTSTNAYRWSPLTETFISVALPGGVTITMDTKPTMEIVNECVYIVGWASRNLRYDPTDAAFYAWGWEQVPAAPTLGSIAGTLVRNSVYKYAVSFLDIWTGEESKMGAVATATIGSAPAGVSIDVSALDYTGNRKFNAGPGTNDSDVGIVIWRTGANDNSFRFLALLNPGVTSFSDNGVFTDGSLRPYQGIQQDEPRFSALKLHKGRFYALSKKSSSNRRLHSHFDKSSFFERWRPLDFSDLDVPEGDVLTAIGGTDATLLTYSQRGCFRSIVSASATAMYIADQRLPWLVGCVGPAARDTIDGWEYFLSERAPYRWREGLVGPEPIGENILPLFIDQSSDLCKLNEKFKEFSEVEYDYDSNLVSFLFPTADATRPSAHMAYWHDAGRVNGDARLGWFPQSTICYAMDLNSALVGMDAGLPISPRTRHERFVWADKNGYVYEYDRSFQRGGLVTTAAAEGTVIAGATLTTVPTVEVLYTTGDGMKGLRFEIEKADGSLVEVRTVLSNTAGVITLDAALSFVPAAGAFWRVAGIPSFWKSWFDHFGEPHQHKTMMDFSVGYQQREPNPNVAWNINVLVGAGEFPTAFTRSTTAKVDKFRKKFTVSMTAVYFMYEFGSSLPDRPWLVTDIEREVEIVPARRLA